MLRKLQKCHASRKMSSEGGVCVYQNRNDIQTGPMVDRQVKRLSDRCGGWPYGKTVPLFVYPSIWKSNTYKFVR